MEVQSRRRCLFKEGLLMCQFKPYPEDIFITHPCVRTQEPDTAWEFTEQRALINFLSSPSQTFEPNTSSSIGKCKHLKTLDSSTPWYRCLLLGHTTSCCIWNSLNSSLDEVWACGDHRSTCNAWLWLWPVFTGCEWNRWAWGLSGEVTLLMTPGHHERVSCSLSCLCPHAHADLVI